MSVSLRHRALPTCVAGLAVIVALLGNASSGQSQTVTANFGSRSGSVRQCRVACSLWVELGSM